MFISSLVIDLIVHILARIDRLTYHHLAVLRHDLLHMNGLLVLVVLLVHVVLHVSRVLADLIVLAAKHVLVDIHTVFLVKLLFPFEHFNVFICNTVSACTP